MFKNKLFLKIILIFTLPALGILFFSTKLVWEKLEYTKEVYKSVDNVKYIRFSSELLNSLQKERDLSLVVNNSKKLLNEFNKQIETTNNKFNQFFDFSQNYIFTNNINENIKLEIDEIKFLKNDLEKLRENVLKSNENNINIVETYSKINKDIIDSVFSVKLVKSAITFNNEFLNVSYLLNLKENISLESAYILIAYYLKELSPQLEHKLLSIYTLQSEQLEHFYHSSEKILTIYENGNSKEIESKINFYRANLKNLLHEEKFDELSWFNLSEIRLDLKNISLTKILNELEYLANSLKQKATLDEHFSLIFLVMSFATLISLLFVLRNIILNEQKSYQKVTKQKKVYELLNQMNKYILKKNSKEELYEEINALISENSSMVFSFIYDIEDGEENSKFYALEGEMKEILESRLEEYKDANSDNLLTRVIKWKSNIIIENFTLKNISVFYKFAKKFNIKSAIALPIKKFDKIVSVLVIYSNESKFFDYEVEILFDKMISDMNHVLERLDYEQIRIKQEKQLRISAVAFESSEPMLITDVDAKIIDVNQAFCKFMRYPKEFLMGKNPRIFKSPHQKKDFYQTMWSKLKIYGSWNGEIYNSNGDDEIVPVRLAITVIRDDLGNVTNYLGQYYDIADLKDKEQILQYQATHDNLTGLPNRLLLLDRIEHAITKVVRHKIVGGLIFIDLDNFKEVNDTLGHDVGDILLVEIAKKLKQNVRDEDTVSRIGGDEFIVLADNIGRNNKEALENIERLANKIKKSLNGIEYINGHKNVSTPSIGVTLFSDASISVQDLIKQADKAMYAAKKQGKNTIEFFN